MQLDKLQKSLMKKEEIGGRIIDVIISSNQIIILVLAKLDIKLNIHLRLDRNGEPYDLHLAMPRPILLLLHGECCLTPQKLSPGFPCDSSLFLYQFLVNFRRKSISSSRSNIFEWRVTHYSMPFIEYQGLDSKKTQVWSRLTTVFRNPAGGWPS